MINYGYYCKYQLIVLHFDVEAICGHPRMHNSCSVTDTKEVIF